MFLKPAILSFTYPVLDKIARKISSWLGKGKIADFFISISIAIIYIKIMQRVRKLSELTEYHNLNLELFLPNVKKGMITGRSNSIWHGLFLKKPTYNCIDEDKGYYSDTKMHKYTMKYFDVHGNYHKLKFDQTKFDIIDDRTRELDFIEIIEKELTNNATMLASEAS